jgi:hypothetical protein
VVSIVIHTDSFNLDLLIIIDCIKFRMYVRKRNFHYEVETISICLQYQQHFSALCVTF